MPTAKRKALLAGGDTGPSVTARECLTNARAAGAGYQRQVNAFIDEFRRATPAAREALSPTPSKNRGRSRD